MTKSESLDIRQVSLNHPDLTALVAELDKELAVFDGDDHAFYDQFNGLDALTTALVAYRGGLPIGCGGLKRFEPSVAEIKRMYVLPEYRRAQTAAHLLEALEKSARQLGFARCILETGVRQVAAVGLYERSGYQRIPNYAQYAGVADSVCYTKELLN